MKRFGQMIVFGVWLALLGFGLASAAESVDDLPFQTNPSTPAPLVSATQHFREGKYKETLKESQAFLKEHPESALGYEILAATALAQHQIPEAQQALSDALRLDPSRPIAMALSGQVALEHNDAPHAEQYFSEAIKQLPKFILAYRGRALALLRLGRLQEAAEASEEAVKRSGEHDVKSLYVLAGIYHEMGRHESAEQALDAALDLQPTFQQALLLQGMVKLDLQKFDEAKKLLTRVTQRDPQSPWGRLGLSVIQRLDGQVADSRAQLEQITKANPQWPLASFELGETLLTAGDSVAAANAFSSAIGISTTPVLTRLRIAGVWLKYGNADRAIAEASEAMKTPEAVPQARSLLVQAYLASGRQESAEHLLQDAVAANPLDKTAALMLGQYYLQQHRPQDALTSFGAALASAPGDIEVVMAEARAYAALGKSEDAVRMAQAVVTSQKQTPESLVFLGSIYEVLKQMDKAEQTYVTALMANPRHAGARRALALLYAHTNRREKALQELTAIASTYLESATPLIDLAQLYEQAGNIDQAIACYRKVLTRNRYQPIALNNLALLLSHDPKTTTEAFELAQRAYRLAPNSPQIGDTLGWMYHTRGDESNAQTLLTQAVTAAPEDAEARYHLGMVYLGRGDKEHARVQLQRAVESPTFSDVEQAKSALNSL